MAKPDLETSFSFPVQVNGSLANDVKVDNHLISAVVQAVSQVTSDTVKKIIITFVQAKANIRIISTQKETFLIVEKFRNIAEVYNKAISDIESSSFYSPEMKQEAINTITRDYSSQIAKLLEASQKDSEPKETVNIFYPNTPTTNLQLPPLLLPPIPSFPSLPESTDKRDTLLGEFIEINPELTKKVEIVFSDNSDRRLTPKYLLDVVNPYLLAIADIQNVLSNIRGKSNHEVVIKSISQNSPISVSLDGAAQAMQTIVDYVVPSKRKIADEIAKLSISDKQVEIESKRAEVLEKRARATKDRAESEKLLAEADTQKAEAVKLKLQNEKLRLELQQVKIQMAMDILKQVAPNLSEIEKVEYLLKLLPPLDIVIFSSLDVQSK